nr:MAG TPA_asm: Prokaryotic membrane lipoprotein lipid attachment site [Caudoviricetes sp.]
MRPLHARICPAVTFGDRDMKRMILGAMAAALLSGCATEQVPSDYKAGDYVVTLTATSSKENAAFRAARICGDNAYRAFSYPREGANKFLI